MNISIAMFSNNKSFISSQDLFELIAYVTNVCVNSLDFTLASLALPSLVGLLLFLFPLAITSPKGPVGVGGGGGRRAIERY